MKLKSLGICLMALSLAVGSMMLGVKDVQAKSLMEEVVVSEEETSLTISEDTNMPLVRSNHLAYGTSQIEKLASNKVSVIGITQAHHLCDTLYLTVTLERKENGTYTTYKTFDFTSNSVYSLSKSIEVIVPSGYYYRVRGYHAAKDSGVKESTTTLTQGVMID